MIKKFLTLVMMILILAVNVQIITCEDANDMKNIKEINFGIISTESSANLMRGFDPFLKDMEKALGVKVKAFFASDYAGVIEAMRFNKVQIAWFGNKSAIEAVDRASGEVFAQTTDPAGLPGYYSLLLVHKDSPYNSLDDIIKNGKNLSFGNGDVNSTSGYLIPTYYCWVQNNIVPEKFFKNVKNSNHETNIMAVAMKQVDFATNNTEQYDKLVETNPKMAANLKVIWKSPMIPKDPLVWRKDLPRELKARIKAFILGYGRTGDKNTIKKQLEILKGMATGFGPFFDSSNAQLITVREINYAKDLLTVQNDDKYDEKTKAAKINEINKKIADLKLFSSLLEKF
jgi:phosphonate transport system substrate-binding protein